MDAETKIVDLNTAMLRLQEKISTMESEEKVQRQALLSTPVKSISEHLSIPIAPKNLENGYHEVEEHKEPQSAPPAIKEYGNGDPKLRKSCVDRQLENVDALIDCVGKKILDILLGSQLLLLPYTNVFFIGNHLRRRRLVYSIVSFS